MPAIHETDQANHLRVRSSSSREHTRFIVSPPIKMEDEIAFEIGMRALHGPSLDPRRYGAEALQAANEQQEGATVFEAPQADRMSEVYGYEHDLIKTMNDYGYTVVDDRGRPV